MNRRMTEFMSDDTRIAPLLAPISDAEPLGKLLDEDVANGPWDRQESLATTSFDWERQLLDNVFGDQTRTKYEEGVRWAELIERCEATLRKESKDLRTAIRWTQAQFVLRGLSGLADGLLLARRLLEWPGDLECQPFAGSPQTADEAIVSTLKWIGRDLNKLARHAPIAFESGGGPILWGEVDTRLSAAVSAVGSGPIDELRTISAALDSSIESCDIVMSKLKKKLIAWYESRGSEPDDSDFSGTTDLSYELRKMREFIDAHAGGRLAPVEAEPEVAAEEVATGVSVSGSRGSGGGRARMSAGEPLDRSDALAAIERIATFFEKHEPNSPVPIMLRKSIRWANLGFGELMKELVSDNRDALSSIAWRVGMSEE